MKVGPEGIVLKTEVIYDEVRLPDLIGTSLETLVARYFRYLTLL